MLNRNFGHTLGSRSLALAANLNLVALRLRHDASTPKCAGSKRPIRASHLGEIRFGATDPGMPASTMRDPMWAVVSPRPRVAVVAEAPPSDRWPVDLIDAPRRGRGQQGDQVQPGPDRVESYRRHRARPTAERSTRRPATRPCVAGG